MKEYMLHFNEVCWIYSSSGQILKISYAVSCRGYERLGNQNLAHHL